jgi:hypothetical protein
MVWLEVGLTVNLNTFSVKQCVEIYTETKLRSQAFHRCNKFLKSDIKSPQSSSLKKAKFALEIVSLLKAKGNNSCYSLIYVVHI